MLKLVGYSDVISVAPGETIQFKVSADAIARYHASIVRLIHGDANPAGPGFKVAPVTSDIEGFYPGRFQPVHAGSYMVVDDHPALAGWESATFGCLIWPTRLEAGRQTLIAMRDPVTGAGVALEADKETGLVLVLGDGERVAEVAIRHRLEPRYWTAVSATIDRAAGRVRLSQRPVQGFPLVARPAAIDVPLPLVLKASRTGLMVAAAPAADTPATGHFDGKIERPWIAGDVLQPAAIDRLLQPGPVPADLAPGIIALWDFSRDIPGTQAIDLGPHGMHGWLVNMPTRAMKGAAWTGGVQAWTDRPEHYGAIHFHCDDLYDAGWSTDFAWTVPHGARSGVYCAHIRSEDGAHEDYIPFALRPPAGTATAPIALLLPTASYMAYANDHNSVDGQDAEMLMGRLVPLQPGDLFIDEHREYGLALYDSHADGSGVSISSRLRPILNMRPKYASWLGAMGSGLWQFNADTHLTDWLEAKGFAYDVITDEDLEREGYDLLKPYRAVLTGTHPEYHSTRMWDAMRAYLERGGRLMYLGADGWYWRIAWHREAPGVIEVRRAEDGIRTWEAHPGEYYHAFNGEYGGLWRRLGRPPNVLTGQGFTAQGFDRSGYYVRLPGSFDPRADFIFDGVGSDERIGDFGLVGGGAAGLELDRAEPLLGTPPHTLVLASSEGHTDLMLLVNEEFAVTTPNLGGSQHPKVHGDLVFFETAAGGAVFGVGSIAWCGSLSHNGYANNVSRITENVLRRFLDPGSFAPPP